MDSEARLRSSEQPSIADIVSPELFRQQAAILCREWGIAINLQSNILKRHFPNEQEWYGPVLNALRSQQMPELITEFFRRIASQIPIESREPVVNIFEKGSPQQAQAIRSLALTLPLEAKPVAADIIQAAVLAISQNYGSDSATIALPLTAKPFVREILVRVATEHELKGRFSVREDNYGVVEIEVSLVATGQRLESEHTLLVEQTVQQALTDLAKHRNEGMAVIAGKAPEWLREGIKKRLAESGLQARFEEREELGSGQFTRVYAVQPRQKPVEGQRVRPGVAVSRTKPEAGARRKSALIEALEKLEKPLAEPDKIIVSLERLLDEGELERHLMGLYDEADMLALVRKVRKHAGKFSHPIYDKYLEQLEDNVLNMSTGAPKREAIGRKLPDLNAPRK